MREQSEVNADIRFNKRRLRVLHVAPTVSSGDGTSLAVIAMLRALSDDSDLDVQLLAGEYRHLPLHSALSRESGSVHIVPVFQPLRGRRGLSFGYPPDFRRSLSRLASSVDLVHVHGLWLYPTLLGCQILRRLRRPYVLSLHGSLMVDALRLSRLKKLVALALFERKNVDAAAAVVATSQPELDQLRSLGFSAPATVIPLAVDPAAMESLSGQRSLEMFLGRRERTLLCVSRFHSQKRLVELVRAFARIANSAPDWHLRIVGPDYERGYRSKVLAAARASGVAERIALEPALEGERLWDAYRGADVFVLTSTFENFGLVIGEALAAGIPTIATRGAPWPQLNAQRCGWWIDSSLESLHATLLEAMSAPPTVLWEMGQRGERVIASEFSLRALGVRLSDLYRSISEARMLTTTKGNDLFIGQSRADT